MNYLGSVFFCLVGVISAFFAPKAHGSQCLKLFETSSVLARDAHGVEARELLEASLEQLEVEFQRFEPIVSELGRLKGEPFKTIEALNPKVRHILTDSELQWLYASKVTGNPAEKAPIENLAPAEVAAFYYNLVYNLKFLVDRELRKRISFDEADRLWATKSFQEGLSGLQNKGQAAGVAFQVTVDQLQGWIESALKTATRNHRTASYWRNPEQVALAMVALALEELLHQKRFELNVKPLKAEWEQVSASRDQISNEISSHKLAWTEEIGVKMKKLAEETEKARRAYNAAIENESQLFQSARAPYLSMVKLESSESNFGAQKLEDTRSCCAGGCLVCPVNYGLHVLMQRRTTPYTGSVGSAPAPVQAPATLVYYPIVESLQNVIPEIKWKDIRTLRGK